MNINATFNINPAQSQTTLRGHSICIPLVTALLALVASFSGVAQADDRVKTALPTPENHDDPKSHPYLGMWETADGGIRHELLPNGRYDEQRGHRKHAYQGRYWVRGNKIVYLDDTGFTADGEFRDGRFYHGGYIFYRVVAPPAKGR